MVVLLTRKNYTDATCLHWMMCLCQSLVSAPHCDKTQKEMRWTTTRVLNPRTALIMLCTVPIITIIAARATSLAEDDGACLCNTDSSTFDALMNFFSATNGNGWAESFGWGNMTTLCLGMWHGVQCSDGQVTNISLVHNNLTGTLTNGLALGELLTLDLSNNNITGILPASWASALPSLATLNLSHNELNGTLPSLWNTFAGIYLGPPGEETARFALDLSSNSLTGTLPSNWSFMTRLRALRLDNNLLIGTLPSEWSAIFSYADGPSVFTLASNQVSGTLPFSWGRWWGVELFDLSGNLVSGSIPDSWGSIGSGSGMLANFSHNCLAGTWPVPFLSENDVDICNTNLFPSGNVACLPDAKWPNACDSSRTSLVSISLYVSTLSFTKSLMEERREAQRSMLLTAAAVAPLPATALLSAASGIDPGSAQALVATLQSPCNQRGGEDGNQNTKGASFALSPLVLFGNEDTIGPFEIAVGNVGLCVAVVVVHSITTLLHYQCSRGVQHSPETPNISRAQQLACSRSGAFLKFPSMSIRIMMFFFPGIAWAATTLTSDIPRYGVARASAGVAVGVAFVVSVFVAVDVVVRGRWMHTPDRGIHFCPYRGAHPFVPPLPRSVAAVFCSRRGQWGPASRRNAFGSPVASAFLPKHVRWVWTVSPLVSLVAVVLSTVHPPAGSVTQACDALQSVLIVLFVCTAAMFAWLLPHRCVLRSLLSAFTNGHNAVVVLLGAFSRHDFVTEEMLVSVASAGSYVSLGVSVFVVVLERVEIRMLAKRDRRERQAAEKLALGRAGVDIQEAAFSQENRLAMINREVALQRLIALICDVSNDDEVL